MSWLIQAPALGPVVAIGTAFAIPVIGLLVRRRTVWEGIALGIATLIFFLTIATAYLTFTSSKPILYLFGGWPPPIGIVYEVDKFSAILGVVIGFLTFLTVLYSIRYTARDYGVQYYYTLLLGFTAGLLGCAYTGDLFNLFVMFEVLSLSAYALASFRKDIPEAVEGGIKYAIVGAVATTMYFIAVTFVYGAFGTLNMADVAAKVRGLTFPVTGSPVGNVTAALTVAVALAVWAFAVEGALVPNHFWLPDAYSAAPVTFAILSSGAAVKVSLYVIARLLYTILQGPSGPYGRLVETMCLILLILGCLSAIVGSVMMLVQSNVNRLVAYSTIVNTGYIAMGLGLGTPLGILAALYHMVNHAVAKATLFFCVGAYSEARGGRRYLDELAGVGRYMPYTTFCLIVACLALAGVPPLNCFVSKLILAEALLERGLAPLIAVIIFSSAMSLIAYLKLIYHIYCRPPASTEPVRESGLLLGPALTTAVLCLLLGVLAPLLVPQVLEPAVRDLLSTDKYISVALEYAEKILGRR